MLEKLAWKYKIWVLLAGAVLSVFLALSWNWILAIILGIVYIVMFSLVIRKQFFKK